MGHICFMYGMYPIFECGPCGGPGLPLLFVQGVWLSSLPVANNSCSTIQKLFTFSTPANFTQHLALTSSTVTRVGYIICHSVITLYNTMTALSGCVFSICLFLISLNQTTKNMLFQVYKNKQINMCLCFCFVCSPVHNSILIYLEVRVTKLPELWLSLMNNLIGIWVFRIS